MMEDGVPLRQVSFVGFSHTLSSSVQASMPSLLRLGFAISSTFIARHAS